MKCLCFELFNLAVTGDIKLSVGEAIKPLERETAIPSQLLKTTHGRRGCRAVSSLGQRVKHQIQLLTLFPYQPELLPFPEDPSCGGT